MWQEHGGGLEELRVRGGKAWGFAGKDEAFGFRSQCSQVPGNFEHRGENGLREH